MSKSKYRFLQGPSVERMSCDYSHKSFDDLYDDLKNSVEAMKKEKDLYDQKDRIDNDDLDVIFEQEVVNDVDNFEKYVFSLWSQSRLKSYVIEVFTIFLGDGDVTTWKCTENNESILYVKDEQGTIRLNLDKMIQTSKFYEEKTGKRKKLIVSQLGVVPKVGQTIPWIEKDTITEI
jgi:hypothetical protein